MSALHLDVGHHLVADHLGDQSDEAVACRAADAERIGRQWGRFRPPEFSEDIPGDNLAAGLILTDRNAPCSIRRRTVSSLTPSSSAASLIRRFGQILPIRDRGRLSRTVDEHRVLVGRSRS